MRRNQLVAPACGSTDLSVFKNNKFAIMDHPIQTQFPVEMFNLFKRAPGIGPGEPFNT